MSTPAYLKTKFIDHRQRSKNLDTFFFLVRNPPTSPKIKFDIKSINEISQSIISASFFIISRETVELSRASLVGQELFKTLGIDLSLPEAKVHKIVTTENNHQQKISMNLKIGLALWSVFESMFWFSLFCIGLQHAGFEFLGDTMKFVDLIGKNWYFWLILGDIEQMNLNIQSESK